MKYLPIIKLFTFLIAAVILSACQKVIVLDLNTAEPILVIEGNVTTKEGFPQTVFLSTSGSFYTGEGIVAVSDATVILKDGEGVAETLEMYAPGLYFTYDFSPKEDVEYSVEVLYKGEVYQGSEVFPTKKVIDSLSYVVNHGLFGGNGVNEDGDTTYNIICRFQDPEETLDYYRFVVYLNDSLVQAGFNTYMVADDELFNGQLFDLEIMGTGAIKGDTVTIDLQSTGANTYLYYYGLNDALSSGAGATPYNPISNLSNDALGYFGAYTSDSQNIFIE
jgi:hypothetical protein